MRVLTLNASVFNYRQFDDILDFHLYTYKFKELIYYCIFRLTNSSLDVTISQRVTYR